MLEPPQEEEEEPEEQCKYLYQKNFYLISVIKLEQGLLWLLSYGSWITTKVVSSNPSHGEVYSIKHYLIKFVSDLRQVNVFLRVFRFLSLIKLTTMIKLKYC